MAKFREMKLQVHPAVLRRLEWEAEFMEEATAGEVLINRLMTGLYYLKEGIEMSFWWHEPTAKVEFFVKLPKASADLLEQWSVYFEISVDALVHGLATAFICERREIRDARQRLGIKPEFHPEIPLHDMNISPYAQFGFYGSSLFMMLARDTRFSPERFAALHLARDVARTGRCGGVRVSDEARTIARLMVREAKAS